MAFSFVLVTIIFELVFSQPDYNNRFFFNDNKKDDLVLNTLKFIFYLFPSFPLSLCYGALVKVAARHMDQQVFAWIPGKDDYSWEDFSSNIHGKLVDGLTYTMPSPLRSVEAMIKEMVLFMVLTWYFDHTVSANRGVADPPYFILTKKYWKGVFGIKHIDPKVLAA
jgi:hypothetical protein